MDVYVSGVGMTKFGKSNDPLERVMANAATSALQDAQLEPVDAIYIGGTSAEESMGDSNLTTLLSETPGLAGTPSSRIEISSSTGIGAFQTAFYAVASGHVKNALVLAGEKMTDFHTGKATRILSEAIDRFERRYGATLPALAAMIAQKYAQEFHLSPSKLEDILAQVAIKNYSNGSLNPYAQFKDILTKGDYLKSQIVSYPLRLYDCAPMTEGASAIVLTSQPTPVKVSGIGHAADTSSVRHRASFTSFNSTKEAALQAYSMAKLNPSDIQFAEVHDAFTLFEIIGTEDLGLFRPGEGWKALQEGITLFQGRLPINPSGGLKARGHPEGASGLAQLVEIVWQLRGEAGEGRQLEKAEIGLAQSMGGLGNYSFVTLLERTDRKRLLQEGWRLVYRPEIRAPRKFPSSPLKEGIGLLETFTILYAPPEGFRSPLALGFVRTKAGERVMACNLDYRSPEKLKMGRKVHLKPREGLYLFENLSFWNRLKHWIRRSSQP
jgi:acetyl-CoA acetyltransferase